MGKKPTFKLPEKPGSPILVFDRYDNFYREQLLRAIREDFESYPEGITTYHAYVQRVVDSYAGDIVDSQSLGLKDLGNFLKGLNSHVPKIKVLDAYVQIVMPERVGSFRIDSNIRQVGNTFADYLGAPEFTDSGYDRSVAVQNLKGVYQLKIYNRSIKKPDELPPRYLVLKPSASSNYLLSYEFNWWPTPVIKDDRDEHLKLVTGFCIPLPISSITLQREFRFLHRRVGKITMRPQKMARELLGGHLPEHMKSDVIASIMISEEKRDLQNHNDYFARISEKEGMAVIKGHEISDKYTIMKINKRIDLIGGVF